MQNLKRPLQLRGAWIVPDSSTQCLATVVLRLGDTTWSCTSLKMPCLQLLYRPASHNTLENATSAAPGRWCSHAKFDNHRRRSASTTFGLASRSLLTLNRIVPRAAACANFRQRGSASAQCSAKLSEQRQPLKWRPSDQRPRSRRQSRRRPAFREAVVPPCLRSRRSSCARRVRPRRAPRLKPVAAAKSGARMQTPPWSVAMHLPEAPKGRNTACVPERTHTDDASDDTHIHTMAHGA